MRVAFLDPRSALLSPAPAVHDRDHAIPGVDPLLDLTPEIVPDGQPVTEILLDTGQPSIDAIKKRILDLDLWVIEGEDRFVVVAFERFPRSAHRVHVLLRHRLLLEAEVGEGAVADRVQQEFRDFAVGDIEETRALRSLLARPRLRSFFRAR